MSAARGDQSFVMVRLPRDLVDRAEAYWDELARDPALRALGIKNSSQSAVRLLLLKGLDDLDKMREDASRENSGIA